MRNYDHNTLLLRHFVRQATFVVCRTMVVVRKIVAVVMQEIMPRYAL